MFDGYEDGPYIKDFTHQRDQNVNPSMNFNKEKNDHAKMRTLFLVTKTRQA
ncbi:hypothetical protein DPMN_021572 [Dreissena polymorpha]|uniref:Uncharacterized protein n=1 Tax=Dreissena polymorpha TaxID=45954 RepID=A0A9D4NNZ1_DREPO|nr:hypothetical protein DPMN_021572 [Dreissena polymorpha]